MARSNEEKVEMILCYGESGRNVHQPMRLYNDKFPDMVVDWAYMRRLDGAPPHYDINVRTFLDQVFPERARSPDLTPLDFFFWGFLKIKVYETKPQNRDELRHSFESIN
ncbi:hypothetical protein J6590_036839 [Homalodisca vitripennis]|nr:hypothetical protein J6590_036839 [Homalodisca vitripennis]